MLTKTRAIVLHSFKYGDSKLITELLTADNGRTACVATVSRSPRGKLKKQYFQPLTILETVIDVRPNRNLQHLREARVDIPFTSIPFSPVKLSIALFLSEFIRCATRKEPTDGYTFDYIENSIRWLDGCYAHYANFHLVFMMRMTKFLGFYPNLEGYTPGCRFDLRAGRFVNDVPLHADCLQADEARKINTMLRMNYPNMHLFKMTRNERNRMADIILRYYEIHVPDFPELKSLPVLQELFDDE